MSEPIHPTYGTLEQLLAAIANNTREGYELRIGLHGALSWFAYQYARAAKETGDRP